MDHKDQTSFNNALAILELDSNHIRETESYKKHIQNNPTRNAIVRITPNLLTSRLENLKKKGFRDDMLNKIVKAHDMLMETCKKNQNPQFIIVEPKEKSKMSFLTQKEWNNIKNIRSQLRANQESRRMQKLVNVFDMQQQISEDIQRRAQDAKLSSKLSEAREMSSPMKSNVTPDKHNIGMKNSDEPKVIMGETSQRVESNPIRKTTQMESPKTTPSNTTVKEFAKNIMSKISQVVESNPITKTTQMESPKTTPSNKILGKFTQKISSLFGRF